MRKQERSLAIPTANKSTLFGSFTETQYFEVEIEPRVPNHVDISRQANARRLQTPKANLHCVGLSQRKPPKALGKNFVEEKVEYPFRPRLNHRSATIAKTKMDKSIFSRNLEWKEANEAAVEQKRKAEQEKKESMEMHEVIGIPNFHLRRAQKEERNRKKNESSKKRPKSII